MTYRTEAINDVTKWIFYFCFVIEFLVRTLTTFIMANAVELTDGSIWIFFGIKIEIVRRCSLILIEQNAAIDFRCTCSIALSIQFFPRLFDIEKKIFIFFSLVSFTLIIASKNGFPFKSLGMCALIKPDAIRVQMLIEAISV